VVVWWATHVEIASALARFLRMNEIDPDEQARVADLPSVVIHNFNLEGIAVAPYEADAVLRIDANAVLAFALAAQPDIPRHIALSSLLDRCVPGSQGRTIGDLLE
jgi:hypothetical protein